MLISIKFEEGTLLKNAGRSLDLVFVFCHLSLSFTMSISMRSTLLKTAGRSAFGWTSASEGSSCFRVFFISTFIFDFHSQDDSVVLLCYSLKARSE